MLSLLRQEPPIDFLHIGMKIVKEDDPILYVQYMPHYTVACHTISPSVNSGDPGNTKF
jgi:hypothetical protein